MDHGVFRGRNLKGEIQRNGKETADQEKLVEEKHVGYLPSNHDPLLLSPAVGAPVQIQESRVAQIALQATPTCGGGVLPHDAPL